jgi:hypothetical protein
MKDYLAPDQRDLLHRHGLDSFAALWDLPLEAVDKPNVERGGWSNVARLELDGAGFYLKRQSNYVTRTLQHPLGEATVARELRNIRRYARLGVPSLEALFYGERKVGGEHQAILLTRALDGWAPLDRLLGGGRTCSLTRGRKSCWPAPIWSAVCMRPGCGMAASIPSTSSCAARTVNGAAA